MPLPRAVSAAPSAPAAAPSDSIASPSAAKTPERAVAKGRATATAAAPVGERPAWVNELSAEDAAKVMKLDPEQRQAWLRKHLEQRARIEAEAMTGPNPPDWMKRLPPDAVERLQKLSPERRQAWLLKRMLERAQQ